MDAEGIMARPAYLDLGRAGLRERIEQARELMGNPCRVCPRGCKVNRAEDDRRGFCRAGARAIVSSFGPHFGEEAPLVGSGGSGTIFFASCNLACVFCQNWQISQAREGEEASPEQLARMMLWLQQRGCHNINLVSPTIYVPQILAALPRTRSRAGCACRWSTTAAATTRCRCCGCSTAWWTSTCRTSSTRTTGWRRATPW